MLETEFRYFEDHEEELIEQYKGRFVIIRGEEVVGVFDGQEDAHKDALGRFEKGTYLIRQCSKNSGTMTYHSRVVLEA